MKKYFLYGLLLIAALIFNVNIARADVDVDGITLTGCGNDQIKLFKGESYNLSNFIRITPDNATNKNVTWETSNNNCVTVNSEGIVNPIGENECLATIKITTKDGKISKNINIQVFEKIIYDTNGGKFSNPNENVPNCIYLGKRQSMNSDNTQFSTFKNTETLNSILSKIDVKVTKDGKYFAGWYTDPINGEYVPYDSVLKDLKSNIVYAHWSDTPIEIKSIKVDEDLTNNPLKIVGIRSVDCEEKGANDKLYNMCTKTLSIKVEPEYAALNGKFNWKTSNENMVKLVDTNKSLISINNAKENISGEATVTMNYKDNNINFTDSYIVRIYNDKNTHTYFYPESATIKAGEEYSIRAYNIPISDYASYPRSIAFKIDDENIAQKNANDVGYTTKVKGLKAGTTTITAENASNNFILTVEGDLTYIVVYEGNGGTLESGTMANQTGKYGEDLILSKNEYKKENYSFGGWKAYIETYENGEAKRTLIEDNNRPIIYPDEATIKNLNIQNGNKLILVAEWIKNPKTGLNIPVIAIILLITTSICGYVISRKMPKINKI